MKTNNIIRILLFLAAVCSAEAVLSQDKQNMFNPVNTAATFMSIAPDARGGGMGDIGAATEADVNSQYWNPAKYPFNIARAGVGISYTPWLTAPCKPRCATSVWAKSIWQTWTT